MLIDWEKCLLVKGMLIRDISARTRLVPCLLCATGLAALVFSGCRKDESSVAPPVAEPVAPASTNPLTVARVARDRLAVRLHAILEEAQDRMPDAGDAALKAELEKNAEWVRLKREFDETEKKIDALRKAKCAGAGQVQGKISK